MNKILRTLAIISVLLMPLAVVVFRLGAVPFATALKMLMASFVIAALVLLISVIQRWRLRKSAPEQSRIARQAAYISLIPILLFASQIGNARNSPAIHNISTDLVDPPAFDKVATLRRATDNPLAYSEEVAVQQKQAYPDVQTIVSELSSEVALAKAKSVVQNFNWELVNVDPSKGIVEATETTAIWGFKDDVVIRVRPLANGSGGSEIDLRSISRIGKSDLGKNASRITEFTQAFNTK